MKRSPRTIERRQIQLLAPFNQKIGRFLQFSQQFVVKAGLQSQQRQPLLQISGAPDGTLAAISYIADVVRLRHNSVVERQGKSTPQTALAIPGR
ncbi:hypothetical protein [Terriglobus albidus]|uniref:hypothetical protein n=1 Tax=Terriglobus albidus TaxID=1592106 RepID=UPI0021E06DC2|nr:hypothetical protein [Terriglobus albidus]